MTRGRASGRFKPYLFILQRKGLSHAQFSQKFMKGTITDYLLKAGLIQQCIDWLKINYLEEGFYGQAGGKKC